jgi:hypothetical protein
MPRTTEQQAIVDAGRGAYARGESSLTCPHDPRSDDGLLWLTGYTEARRDDQYGPVR